MTEEEKKQWQEAKKQWEEAKRQTLAPYFSYPNSSNSS